jgi:hypothetical protein
LTRHARSARIRRESGQGLVEFAMVLPLLVVLVLGIIEVSYAIFDEHTATRLSREGSNLISRDTTLQDAATAISAMSTSPANFNNGTSKVIFSVVRRIATIGASNYNRDILYRRHEYGGFAAASRLQTRGSGAFGSAPDYQALDSDNDTNLQLANLPPSLLTLGGTLYVAEVYTKHTLLTPLDRFGIHLPTTLYSIAYF